MKILVKLPTKKRKEKFFSTLDIFYNLLDDIENTAFLITLDDDDDDMVNDEVFNKLTGYKNLSYTVGTSIHKLSATNRDLETFNNWDILVLASDDTIPKIKGYDSIIRQEMMTNYPDTDGVLHFNDGFQKSQLNTLPIVGKKYYDRFGYVQYPEYKSCFADNEFMEVSRILNKVTYIDTVVIEHQHPDWGFGKHDFVHGLNVQNYEHDQNLFTTRKNKNFDLK